MTDRTYLVAEIKAALEVRGQTWRTNEDAFEITARVAWALRWEGARLVGKRPEQNGALYRGVKYSHDAIAFPSGWIDCLGAAGPPANANTPRWAATAVDLSAQLWAPLDLGTAEPPVVDPPIAIRPPDGPPSPPSAPPQNLDAIAVALAGLAMEVSLLRELLTERAGVLQLDEAVLHGRYALIEAQLRTLAQTQAQGLTGRIGTGVFNTTITLTPP